MQSASLRIFITGLALFLCAFSALAADTCPNCERWNAPQKPFKLYGNAYYVGPHGLSAVLITSDDGHILIDGALPESASQIAAHITELGFKLTDVKVILNSHVHYDHAGGLAELQRLSGAAVKASPSAAKVLESGVTGADDPQHSRLSPIQKLSRVTTLADRESVRVGRLAVTAHFTPGHTPGGTTWTWQSCEGPRCLNMVYGDSMAALAALPYRYSDHPEMVRSLEGSLKRVAALPCDILVSAHPEFSELWERLGKRDRGDANGLIDRDACRRYVDLMRGKLKDTLAAEAAANP